VRTDRIGHAFRDPELLQRALTHRSAGSRNNERLEFLGDALVNLVVAEALFQRWPRADEGELTRARAALVREASLANLARQLELGDEPLLLELPRGGPQKDAKTRLQEWLQARQLPLPEYRLVASRGEDHDKVFEIECVLGQPPLQQTAEGGSRRQAEQAAALLILQQLESSHERA
jgi:ribonuclease-3